MVALVNNCSVKMTLRLFYGYDYGANASEAGQKIAMD